MCGHSCGRPQTRCDSASRRPSGRSAAHRPSELHARRVVSALTSGNASPNDLSRPAIGCIHDVRVRLQGQRRTRVPESAGHGADVDAAGQHDRGGEMAEMVEADVCSPRSLRRAMNREVTPPGRSGDDRSGDEDHRYAFGSSGTPRAAERALARSRRSSSTESVAESSAIFRMCPVLVDRISTRPGRSEIDRRTSSSPFSKSTSDHRRPQSSPRRQPVVAATKSRVASSGSFSSARSIRSLISSGVGASGSFCTIVGGDAWAAGERSRRPHLTPWFRAAEHTAWYRRTLVPDRPRRLSRS